MCGTENEHKGSCPHGGCCSGSSSSRRTFLKRAIGILSAPLFALLAWPFIQSIIGTIFRLPKASYAKVGLVADFPIGKPISPKFKYKSSNEYFHSEDIYNIWVIRHSDTKVTVFSPICPHLGCQYDWYPQAEKFICPCHGSVYSIEGKVLGGPAPRSLDTLPWKIENDELYVEWERFRVGIPQKIRIG